MSLPMSMKQLGSRNVGCIVEQMEWSNKMDLIAFGNEKGEVVVQRLNWQKIVTFPSPGDGIRVCSLSWHSDEPVLAVGYSNGKVALLDVEREEETFSVFYDESINKIYFTKQVDVQDYKQTYRKRAEPSYEAYLSPLPPLTTAGSSIKPGHDRKYSRKSSPCFLVVLLNSGKVHLLLLGVLNAGTIDLSQHVQHPDDFVVHDVRLSCKFNGLYALVRDGNNLYVLHFNNIILRDYLSPMLHLAQNCSNILETKNYINDTIQCMTEAWETVLMEMDNKLTKYASQQPEGSISADFLELLVCGYATLEIEEFLMDELTEKGVKKLATSVELSCSSVQNLVMKPLQCAAINLFYFLNTIKGLSRITYFFEPLLQYSSAESASRICGAFLLKVQELQQVIDQCVSDIKLFFTWLCVVILRLRQEDVPEEATLLSPEDRIYLAEYLNSFEDSVIEHEDGSVTKRKFNLEKVGQYLENRNLHQVAKTDLQHSWHELLEENECLRDCELIFPHNKQASLIQERDRLFQAIDETFQKPGRSITTCFELDSKINCSSNAKVKNEFVRCSYFSCEIKERDFLLTSLSQNECLILEFDKTFAELKCIRIQLRPGPFTTTSNLNASFANLNFVDLKFYNENIISLLLKGLDCENRSPFYFVQFSLDMAKHRCTQHSLPQNLNLEDSGAEHNFVDTIDNLTLRNIEGICTHLAVSGSRKVATILSENQTKMTIFEMEIEDDDDETEISQNSFLEISKESTE